MHEVTVGMPFGLAAARLAQLLDLTSLEGPSEVAYEPGLTTLLRVGPFGNMRGSSKLVRVRVLAPVCRGNTMMVALRWEATGAAGELFPVLDADLTLTDAGPDQVRLALARSYRPPFGKAGEALDTIVMHRVATATIRSLAESVATALVQSGSFRSEGTVEMASAPTSPAVDSGAARRRG